MTTRRKDARRRIPRIESLERRELLSATQFTAGESLPVSPLGETGAAAPSTSTFIDPTAIFRNVRATTIGNKDYIGPFATFVALRGATISIGNESNVQDNVIIRAGGRNAGVVIGDQAIVAHGATIIGPATIGAPGGAPAFVGFNAVIDGATVQPGAMVSGLARVAPGIVIRTGFRVLPGMFIQTQAEADDINLGKVEEVTDGDLKFMKAVVHVNEVLAAGYSEQAAESPSSVFGIGPNPPAPPFAPNSYLPTLAGAPALAPRFRNRIIGDVQMTNSLPQLRRVMGVGDAIRADEAHPFLIGRIGRMGNRVTIHGLEESDLSSGHANFYGNHSTIHGGLDSGQAPQETTIIGSGVRIFARAVVFRSTIGDGSVIGPFAYVEASTLAPGTVVPRGAIIVDNVYRGRVQWIR